MQVGVELEGQSGFRFATKGNVVGDEAVDVSDVCEGESA